MFDNIDNVDIYISVIIYIYIYFLIKVQVQVHRYRTTLVCLPLNFSLRILPII